MVSTSPVDGPSRSPAISDLQNKRYFPNTLILVISAACAKEEVTDHGRTGQYVGRSHQASSSGEHRQGLPEEEASLRRLRKVDLSSCMGRVEHSTLRRESQYRFENAQP